MAAYVKLLAIVVFGIFVTGSAHAAPFMFDAKPKDGGFRGVGGVNFTVNITDVSLDTGSVRVFVISENGYNQGEAWDNFTMQCANYGGDNWICSRIVSFAIAGTDTLEFFYFTANDTTGNKGNLGSPGTTLSFTIDRNPPVVTFVNPKKGTYVSGNLTIAVTIYDVVSGINVSSIDVSFDNSSWSGMSGGPNSTFTSQWDTTPHADNESVTIYVRSKDLVNNNVTQSVNVVVENEVPNLVVVSPAQGEFISGVSIFSANVSDSFSGLNSVKFVLGTANFTMQCSGNACTYPLDTTVFSDGQYTVEFTALDKAGNTKRASLNVTVKNSESSVSFSPPQYLSGEVLLTTAITNVLGSVTSVSLDIEGPTDATASMECDPEFMSCTYLMDTKEFGDGPYILTVIANNTLGNASISSANVTVDNTEPSIALNIGDVVKDTFTIRAVITDAGLDPAGVEAEIVSAVLDMSCAPAGASLDCFAQYDSLQLSDGQKEIEITATDLAGNSASRKKTVSVDNRPPEFVFLKIVPTYSGSGTEIIFTAGLQDDGSSVANVTATLRHETFTAVLDMEHITNVWIGKAEISTLGSHKVDLNVTDAGGNTAYFENVGYIFIGELQCGDGICQEEENACLCASDCNAPKCAVGEVLGCMSGVPICVTPAECGDGVCSESESCSSCGLDCGECSAIERISLRKLEISGTSLFILDVNSIIRLIEENPVLFTLVIVVLVIAIAFLVKRFRRPKVVKMWELYGEEK